MDLEEAKAEAAKLFLEGTQGGDTKMEHSIKIEKLGIELPDLLFFGFSELLGWEIHGPWEKVRYGIWLEFKARPFVFEHRKFGLAMLCSSEDRDSGLADEVLGRARGLVRLSERYLEAFGIERINTGHAGIQNLYPVLRERYALLREMAEEAMAEVNPEVADFLYLAPPMQKAAALGTAAVDAYFSVQEHLFALAIAFTEGVPESGLIEFLRGDWGSKFRTVLDLGQDPAIKGFYDRLLQIRREWRNPLAHGGFLSGRDSLFFSVPRFGMVPARLSRTPRGVKLSFSLHPDTFEELMQTFDDFDSYLAAGPLRRAVEWAEAGLDVLLDPRSLAEYREAMRSDELFDSLIQRTNYLDEQHMNMDY